MSVTPHPSDPKYAWSQVSRAEPPKRSAADRIADFLEVYGCLDEAAAQAQASRCIQCPEPVCVEGCPLNNRIPEWLLLTAEGRFAEAAELVRSSGCMPEILSRLCRQSCEAYCLLDEKAGGAIAINAIERFLNDYSQAHSLAGSPVQPSNGHRVAVLGSGPCSLACCSELARAGYAVTILDCGGEPGGLLVKGIPAFQLDKKLVQRRVQQLRQMGVEFRLNVRCGQDVSLRSLRADYDAVFLGWCAEEARPLAIPGADSAGVFAALPFVVQKNVPWASETSPIEVRGKRVVVLGGGDTAIDALRTAIRCGAAEATGLYRRDQTSMPCHPREYGNAVEEGAKFQFLTLPVALAGNAAGQVTHVRCVRTQLGPPDASGRPVPLIVPDPEFEVAADVVLVAYGFVPPAALSHGDFTELAANEWGEVAVDENYMTNLPGVFAAGMLVHRPILLGEVVRDARKAAAAIDRYLCHRRAAASQAKD